jgi:signal peptidase I
MVAAEEYRPELLKPLIAELAAGDIPSEIRVRGDSMRPTLEEGDRVRLVPATANELRVGDLVVWQGKGGPIMHRLVGWWPVGGRRMLTMGDACRRLDPPASPDRMIGRVVERWRGDAVRRFDGRAARLAGRGRAACLLLTGLAVEAWDRVRRSAGGNPCGPTC